MNRQITLAARPEGFPVPEDFKLVENACSRAWRRRSVVENAVYVG